MKGVRIMGELVSIAEATRRLGISKATMLRRLKTLSVQRYINPKDTRERLVDWDEIEALFEVRPEHDDRNDDTHRPD
jgi:DNA-binding Lrp family transcriptional regulator